MEVYVYLLFIVLSLLLLTRFRSKLIVLPFIVLAVFSGFRYNVGIDYPTYELLYEWGADGTQVTSEPFFGYFIKFCHLLGGNTQMFFLLSAIITNLFIYLFIRGLSVNYVMSVLIYLCNISFYLYTFNATRQWLACSVFLYSLILFKKEKYIWYITLNIIAALIFHTSLLFIFPLIFLTKYKKIDSLRIYGYILAVFIGLSSRVILSATMYEGYEDIKFDSTIDLKVYIFLVASILLETIRHRFIDTKDNFSRILVNMNYFSILLLIILVLQSSGTLILLFKRLHNYFFAVYIIYIPYVINNLTSIKGFKEITNIILYAVLVFLYLYTIYYNGEYNKLIPYEYNLNVFK